MTDWGEVSRRIREHREALGLTQLALGERVGSSANYVAQVEGGLALHEKKLALYAEALGLSVPFLRYGVADALDVEAVRAVARQEGRRAALTEVASWVAQASERTMQPIASAIAPEREGTLADAGPRRDTRHAKKPVKKGRAS